jgi:hypothetical protein
MAKQVAQWLLTVTLYWDLWTVAEKGAPVVKH